MGRKLTTLRACVMTWETPRIIAGEVDMSSMSKGFADVFNAVSSSAIRAGFKYPDLSDITEVLVCHPGIPGNIAIFNARGMNQNNDPYVLFTATYQDGGIKQMLYKSDLFGGFKHTEENLTDAIEILYLDKNATQCKIPLLSDIPVIGEPLGALICKIPAFLWLAALSYTVFKTAKSKGREQKINGALAVGSLYMFNRAGGLKAVGIGKKKTNKIADYRGSHKAPGRENAPLYDLTLNDVYPSDVYGKSGLNYYGDGGEYDSLNFSVVRMAKGKPNFPVKIYRAVPNTVRQINHGDWVTITRQYAKDHMDGETGWKIITMTVKAKDIFTNGDSLSEWGYHPE